jgi:hypothetical protein
MNREILNNSEKPTFSQFQDKSCQGQFPKLMARIINAQIDICKTI